MAIDEAMLDCHIEGAVPPTLRLYGWKPAAVSIGYGQKHPEKLIERCAGRGIDVVRRPTGGRAVLHMDELTYSFVGNAGTDIEGDRLLGASIASAYKKICQALIAAIKHLGVELEIGASQPSYRDLNDCFLSTTTADLHLNGKKMVGSAQLRRGSAVLQHGSILLLQSQEMLPELLSGKTADASNRHANLRHANLFEAVGGEVDRQRLETVMRAGFKEVFHLTFADASLSASELEIASSARDRYCLRALDSKSY